MSDQLPWDRFPTPPEEELPYEPPAPVPSPRPEPAPVPPRKPIEDLGVDLGTVAREALDKIWPQLREQAVDYAKESLRGVLAGKTVDVLHPTITAETSTGRELVVADAKSRSGRTFVQGLAIDAFAAATVGVAALSGLDPFQKETWILLGALLAKTVVQSVVSYVMRIKVTPTMKMETERLAIMPVPRPMMKE
jgi:hypothetical protein